MGIFDKVKKTTIESRRYEERLYEVALEEVEAGEIKKGLYAKAVAKADGDKEKADGIYLKLRVQSIMDDIESNQIDQRENEKVLKVIQSLERKEELERQTLESKEELDSQKERSRNSVSEKPKENAGCLLYIALFFLVILAILIDSGS